MCEQARLESLGIEMRSQNIQLRCGTCNVQTSEVDGVFRYLESQICRLMDPPICFQYTTFSRMVLIVLSLLNQKPGMYFSSVVILKITNTKTFIRKFRNNLIDYHQLLFLHLKKTHIGVCVVAVSTCRQAWSHLGAELATSIQRTGLVSMVDCGTPTLHTIMIMK